MSTTRYVALKSTDALLLAHDLSMSDDNAMACQGRALKHLTNMAETWIREELERETDPIDVLLAAQSIAVSFLFSVIGSVTPSGAEAKTADLIGESFLPLFTETLERFKSRYSEPHPETISP